MPPEATAIVPRRMPTPDEKLQAQADNREAKRRDRDTALRSVIWQLRALLAKNHVDVPRELEAAVVKALDVDE